MRPDRLPPDVDIGGLEATVGFRPKVDTGAFSYASHAAVVAVDTELGDVEILDYVSSTSRTITLTLSGSGTPPSSSWTADVDMDLKLAAGASWP